MGIFIEDGNRKSQFLVLTAILREMIAFFPQMIVLVIATNRYPDNGNVGGLK